MGLWDWLAGDRKKPRPAAKKNTFSSVMDEAWNKVGQTIGDVVSLSTARSVGVAVDMARMTTGRELDSGPVALFGLKRGFSSAADLAVGEGSSTGWSLSKVGAGLNWAASKVDDTVETPMYMLATGASRKEAWAAADNTHFVKTGMMLADRTTAKNLGPDFDITEADAWDKYKAASPTADWIDELWADTMVSIPAFTLDPFVAATKGIRGVRALRGVKDRVDKIAGSVERTVVRGDDGSEVVEAKRVPGWAHKKSAAEITYGLRIDKQPYGFEIGTMLERAGKIKDPEESVRLQTAILRAYGGDAAAIRELDESVPEYGYKFINMVKGRGNRSTEAEFADAANGPAIARGEAKRTKNQPDYVADMRDEAESGSFYGAWIDGNLKDRAALKPTIRGDRAVSRLRTEGLGRDNQLHTGIKPVDAAVNKVLPKRTLADGRRNKPAESTLIDGANSVPVTFVRAGLARVTLEGLGVKTAGRVARGAARVSDELRGRHVIGEIDFNDKALVVAAVDNILRKSYIDPAKRGHFVNRAATASGTNQISEVWKSASEFRVREAAKRYGVDEDIAAGIAADLEREARDVLASVQSSSFGRARREDGTLVDTLVLADEDGLNVFETKNPVFNSQTPDSGVALDFDRMEKMLKRDTFARAVIDKAATFGSMYDPLMREAIATGIRVGRAERAQTQLGQLLRTIPETANSWWKTGTLVLRFGGYAVRNAAEEQLRLFATEDAALVADRALEIKRHQTLTGKIKSTSEIGPDGKVQPKLSPYAKTELVFHRSELERLGSDLDNAENRADWKALNDQLKAFRRDRQRLAKEGAPTAEVDSAIRWIEELPFYVEYQNWSNDAAQIRARISELENTHALPFSGTKQVKGVPVEGGFREAFADVRGEIAYNAVAHQGQVDQLALDYATNMFRRSRPMGTQPYLAVKADDPKDVLDRHINGWDRILNKQLRADRAAQIMLNVKARGGDGDDMVDAVVAWFKTPAAREYRANNPLRTSGSKWAHDMASMIDHHVLSDEMADVLVKRDITPDELNAIAVEDRPEIHQSMADLLVGHKGRQRESWTARAFRNIDQMSVNRASRHPAYVLYYDRAVARRGKTFIEYKRGKDGDGAIITSDEAREIEDAAHREALSGIKRTFYDSHNRSSAAHHLRFVFPFFAAHQNSLTFWGRMVGQHPDKLRQLQIAFDAPTRAGLVVDENNEPVRPGTFPQPDHKIFIPMPDSFVNSKDGKQAGVSAHWSLPLSSANLILPSGSMFSPGAGPLVSVPMGFIQQHVAPRDPEIKKIAQYFSPFGPPEEQGGSAWPTVVKRVREAIDSNSYGHVQMFNIYLTDAQVDFARENGRQPNASEFNKMRKEIGEKVRYVALLRAVGSVVTPIQPQVGSKYHALLSEHRSLLKQQQERGEGAFWADDQFLEKYGDAFIPLIKSVSENRAHLNPSDETVRAYTAHEKFLDTLPDHTVWQVVIGPEGEGAYSVDAYRWMQDKRTGGPGGPTLIQRRSAEDRYFDSRAAEGWRTYRRFMDRLQAEATRMGATSPGEVPALKEAKRLFVADLKADNREWSEAFAHVLARREEYDKTLDGLKQIATHKRLVNDPARTDIRALGKYLAMREKVEGILKERVADGGASTPGAKANDDLRWAMTRYIADLSESDLNFAAYVAPVVESDPWYDDNMLEGN